MGHRGRNRMETRKKNFILRDFVLYQSSSILPVINSKWVRRKRHVACREKKVNTYGVFLVGKCKGKKNQLKALA
jgi:hypothetical protein